jgi:hypothetical protein
MSDKSITLRVSGYTLEISGYSCPVEIGCILQSFFREVSACTAALRGDCAPSAMTASDELTLKSWESNDISRREGASARVYYLHQGLRV